MNLIRKQPVFSRLATALVLLSVFANNASASAQSDPLDEIDNLSDNRFENDENPNYIIFRQAVWLSNALLERRHSKIASLYDTLLTEDQLPAEISALYRNRLNYVVRMRDDYKNAVEDRAHSADGYAASNGAMMNTVLGRALGSGTNNADELNAQIIRHQLTGPMKVIQSLLKFAINQHQKSAALDFNSDKNQLLSHIVDQLKSKPRVLKQVLDDFDFQLRQGSFQIVPVKRAIVGLMQKADEILGSKQIPTIDSLKSLSKEWTKLPNVLEKAKPKDAPKNVIDLLNRMISLTKCPELGIAAYRDCLNNPAKLAAYSAHVDKSQDLLKKWKEYEQTVYGIVIPVLKKIPESSNKESASGIASLILPVLPKLEKTLGKMQQEQLYSNDFNPMFEGTKQLSRHVWSLLKHIEVLADRSKLVTLNQEIQRISGDIGSNIPKQMKTLNETVTANLMLELCMRTREVLKMRIIPFDQDYLELCNVPRRPAKTQPDLHVRRSLYENISQLKKKIAANNALDRQEKNVTRKSTMDSKPIYVWKSKDFKNEITKLLKGEKVILTTDAAAFAQNALKFGQIQLDFGFPKETRQKEFYKAINGFMVNIKMIGNNYYRCDKRIYYVPTNNNVQLRYLIGDDSNKAVSGNALYEEVKKRDPYLSLFSTWELQLINPNPGQDKLGGFIGDEIDLQFKGVYQYVLNEGVGKYNCDEYDLSKHYKLDRILK